MSAAGFDAPAAAAEIEWARQAGTYVEPYSARWPGLTLDHGYEVARIASESRVARSGAARVGRKIGFTNRTIWERYGVHHPIWGWMYEDTVVTGAPGGRAEVSLARLVQPRVEPEIVVRLGAPVRPPANVAEVAAAVEAVAFGYEIVHTHYAGWRFAPVDVVIDAGLHGASRIGPWTEPWPSMVEDLARFTLTLQRNGEALGTGRGADVLDSPLHAIAHLAASVGGDGLGAGEILTTGTVTDAAAVSPGDVFTVSIDGLPLQSLALHAR
jgi:2-keto-4-pentenoate hydratase